MKPYFRFLPLLTLLGLAINALAQGTIQVTNNSTTAFTNTVVEIPWTTVKAVYPQVDTAQLQVVVAGKEVPYQLERRGEKTVQNLLVQVSVGANQSLKLALRKGKPTPVAAKTYARYVPERYDDFAWENDKVAFRIYGAALNGRSDNAYGSDIWAKRTSQLILNKWYKQNNYHKDNGEGLDYYHVGLTLGAGDMGVFLKDSIQFIHNYRSWEVLDNGPLRSTFRVKYDPYTFNGITINTTKTYSLDADSQMSKIQVVVNHSSPQPLPMVVGITLRKEPGMLLLDETKGILGYWEPQHGNDGTIGVGCIFTTEPVLMLRQYQHGLAKVSAKSGDTLTYYSGGAWDKAGQITAGEGWFQYLQQYKSQLKNPLSIQMGK